MRDYGTPDVAVAAESILGEGPVWDGRRQCLYWLDCFSKRINIHWPQGRDPGRHTDSENCSLFLPEVIGSLGIVRTDPGERLVLVVALSVGIFRLDVDEKWFDSEEVDVGMHGLTFLTDPEDGMPNNRFNDGEVDPAGRFWAGTMSRDLDSGAGDLTPKGSLYRMSSSGLGIEAEKMIGDVIISNGIAFEPDSGIMYYNDTPTRKVDAFDFDLENGEITNRRSAFSVPDGWGNPDGMCIDREGMLWIALWDGFRVIRVNPRNRDVLGEIRLPVRNVTSCAFGGSKLNELYITTSRVGIESDDESDRDLAGSLFRLALPVEGRAAYEFSGHT